MKIEYLGHSCFRIESENGIKLVTDPYTKVGYELPKGVNAEIVTVSHGHFDHNYIRAIDGMTAIICEEGEYEINGVEIVGERCWHDPKEGALRGTNLIFKCNIDGITVCHFGDLGEEYSSKIAQILADTDVWLIPVGGTYTIDADEAKTYIEKLKPKAVIPMHYRPQDGALDIAPIEMFLQKMGQYSVITCPSGVFTLTDADFEDGKTKIFYMERRK